MWDNMPSVSWGLWQTRTSALCGRSWQFPAPRLSTARSEPGQGWPLLG